MGAQAYMVDSAADLKPEWVAGKRRVGVTAGASAPRGAGARGDRAPARRWARASVRELDGHHRDVVFTLPRELVRGDKPSSRAG